MTTSPLKYIGRSGNTLQNLGFLLNQLQTDIIEGPDYDDSAYVSGVIDMIDHDLDILARIGFREQLQPTIARVKRMKRQHDLYASHMADAWKAQNRY